MFQVVDIAQLRQRVGISGARAQPKLGDGGLIVGEVEAMADAEPRSHVFHTGMYRRESLIAGDDARGGRQRGNGSLTSCSTWLSSRSST